MINRFTICSIYTINIDRPTLTIPTTITTVGIVGRVRAALNRYLPETGPCPGTAATYGLALSLCGQSGLILLTYMVQMNIRKCIYEGKYDHYECI